MRPRAFDIPALKVDGMDAVEVYRKAGKLSLMPVPAGGRFSWNVVSSAGARMLVPETSSAINTGGRKNWLIHFGEIR